MLIKTVTLAQIKTLKWARTVAKEWRGSHAPNAILEFDAWIMEVDEAIKAVERDRKRLREILTKGLPVN